MNNISNMLSVSVDRWLLVIIFFLVFLTGNAQKHHYAYKNTYPDNNTDSLEQWLKHYPAKNEERMLNLCKLERTYFWKLSPKLLSHLDDMKQVAAKINHKEGTAFYKYMEALRLNMNSNNQLSEKYISEAIKISETVEDISARIGFLSALIIISVNYKDPNDNKIAEYYYTKAQALYSKTNDIHDQIFFLRAAIDLENQRRLTQNNKFESLSIINKILKLYNNNPRELEYATLWVKLVTSQFYYATKDYKKAEEAAKDAIKYADKENYDALSRLYLDLGNIYLEENKLEEATVTYKKGIDACHKIVKQFIFSFPNNSNSKYGTMMSFFKGYRKATLKLKNEPLANMLADSIIHYQELSERELNRKSMLEIQARYNFEQSELDVKNLQLKQLIANTKQKELQAKILTEKQQNEVLQYEEKVLQYNNLMLTNKTNAEKKIASIKSENMRKENSRLTMALAIGFIFLIVLSILSYLLRLSYLKEKKASRFKNQFYTILTHDLRGGINSIIDLGKVINYLLKEGDEVQINKVINQLAWLGCNTSILMSNMLDWGTSQEYGVKPIMEELNLSNLLLRLGEQYRAAIETKGVYLEITIPSVLETNTSEKHLDIIIRNMLDNARKNTLQGGAINLTAKIMENVKIIQIEIKDSGLGIPEDKLSYLNRVLAHEVNPEVGENGIGLGIILMKTYSKKIGGQISVTSRLGEGTSFKLDIPLTK